MPDTIMDLNHAIFGKTEIGQREIKTRELGLPPLVRRLLILIDGKRTGEELAPMLMGQSLDELLAQLIDKDCVSLVAHAEDVAAAVAATPAPTAPADTPKDAATEAALAALPPADSRSEKNLDMARNFMTNTLNMEFGMNMRLSLIEAITNCKTSAELRQVYPTWHATMAGSRDSAKELPALVEKLFRVL
jgi:ribosomal protein L12E/L44/L45/RPP1/RPP2